MDVHFLLVTASYNRPELLIRTIKSLQAQDYPHWQQIIVDDCSSTDMHAVEALAATDARIVFLRLPENQGCNQVRNYALDYIAQQNLQGYISFLDDDDYLLPDALSRCKAVIQSGVAEGWIAFNCCSEAGQTISRLKRYGKLCYLQDYMYGKIIKGDLHHYIDSRLCQGLRFSERFRNGQEWSFFCQLAGKTHLYAVNQHSKVVEYLPGGLSKQKINSQNRLAVLQHKVDVLSQLVRPQQLAIHQTLLARELIANQQSPAALVLLKPLWVYRWYSLRFYRYYFKALLQQRVINESSG